jgi:ParB family chromosome partitioning protein
MTRKKIDFNTNPLLSGPSLGARTRSGSPFRFIPLSDIDIDPDQPRRVFDEEALNQLSSSIAEYGVISPILVRILDGGTYRLISGERRFRAAKMAGLDSVPAMIEQEESDGASLLSKQLVENLQREDLGSMERALAIGQLRDQFSLSVREISQKLGISKSSVQRSLEILGLPDDLQAALIAGASESKILTLAQVEDRNLRKSLLSAINQYSRRELEALIKENLNTEPALKEKVSHGGTAKREPQSLSIEDQRIVEDMQKSLGTKVQMQRGKNGQGRLLIDFYSDDDISELYRRVCVTE